MRGKITLDKLRKEIEADTKAAEAECLQRYRQAQEQGSREEPKRPTPAVLHKMLDDVEAVTKARFYEDPNPIASPVEMFRMPEGKPGGEPFAALSVREKAQVLGDYTNWQEYERHGVGHAQLDQVFWNVSNDKPRDQWLEGSGLDKPGGRQQKTDLQKLQEKAAKKIAQALKAKERDREMDR